MPRIRNGQFRTTHAPNMGVRASRQAFDRGGTSANFDATGSGNCGGVRGNGNAAADHSMRTPSPNVANGASDVGGGFFDPGTFDPNMMNPGIPQGNGSSSGIMPMVLQMMTTMVGMMMQMVQIMMSPGGQQGILPGEPNPGQLDPTQPVPGGTIPGTDVNKDKDKDKDKDTDPPATVAPGPELDRNINFHDLSKEDRTKMGLNDRERAIVHLWGRQVISKGYQDGGIYLNVETSPNAWTPAERSLVAELRAKDEATYGDITGKALDEEFFAVMQKMHPEKKINTEKWLNTPARFADGPINKISDINQLQQQTGLSEFDQGVLRLWGHEPLFNGGKIDGSILSYTIGNENALDNAANAGNKNPGDMNIDALAQQLLDADMTSDGVRNGDSLSFAFGRVLDKVYLGKTEDTMDVVNANALKKAETNGRTPAQIKADVKKGVSQAMADVGSFVKNHPVMSTLGAGAMATAGAVCPFMGGLTAGGMAVAAGNKFLEGKK